MLLFWFFYSLNNPEKKDHCLHQNIKQNNVATLIMIIIVSWAANQRIRVISEASYDPRVMMLKIQLCHHRNTFLKYIKIERYFTILQVLIKLMQPWWDFLKTAYGPQHFWSGVCVNIYIYRSSFIFCCSTHLGGRFHWHRCRWGAARPGAARREQKRSSVWLQTPC